MLHSQDCSRDDSLHLLFGEVVVSVSDSPRASAASLLCHSCGFDVRSAENSGALLLLEPSFIGQGASCE